jgi:putative PIN family toxin of toxin-antitoxin system
VRAPVLRAVIDTNVVLSTLVFGGRLAWLRTRWTRGDVNPIICRETTTELLRVLGYPKFKLDTADRDALLDEYLPFCETFRLPEAGLDLPIACRDRHDTVFIALALFARADCLVSGDGDLTVLRQSSPVPILSPAELYVRVNG